MDQLSQDQQDEIYALRQVGLDDEADAIEARIPVGEPGQYGGRTDVLPEDDGPREGDPGCYGGQA